MLSKLARGGGGEGRRGIYVPQIENGAHKGSRHNRQGHAYSCLLGQIK